MKSISHFRKPFLFRIQRSLSQETLGNTPARSRLNINTMYPRRVRHAVYTQELSSPTANSVDRLRLPPIWFQGSSPCSSAAFNIMLAIKLNPSILLLGLWNFFRSSNIKKRNRISNRGDPWGIPISVQIQLLLYPINLIWVLCTIKKLYMKSISHFRKPFLFRIQRSLLWEILGNTPARSRLSINTMYLWRVCHAICTQELSRPTTNSIDCLCLTPIWF